MDFLTCVLYGFNTCSSCEEQRGRSGFFYGGESFNTCSSCEEQHSGDYLCKMVHTVSIHAPLARSNLQYAKDFYAYMFQYMLLLRGATRAPQS